MHEKKRAFEAAVVAILLLPLLGIGCTLERTVMIQTEPPDATVFLDGVEQEARTPTTMKLTWDRFGEDPGYELKIEKKNFETEVVSLPNEAAGEAKDPWVMELKLNEIRKVVPVAITSNIEDATVFINDRKQGKTPMRYDFEFTRESGTAPWTTYSVKIDKEGYRYQPEGEELPPGEMNPFFQLVDLAAANRGEIAARLEPLRFIRTKVKRLVMEEDEPVVEEEKVLSQVGDIDQEPMVASVTMITDARQENAFMETRISSSGSDGGLVYAMPFRQQDNNKVFTNLWLQDGKTGRIRLTDAHQIDFDASVSMDGKYLYFTSDRLGRGRQTIWRMNLKERSGLTKITDSPSSSSEAEPSLSPDGNRLVYTCTLKGSNVPQIWVSNPDGTMPMQLRTGKNPSWSPDSKMIAFVVPDDAGKDKLWIMEANGGRPTQITFGTSNDRHPVWTKDGERIIYSSDQIINEAGEHNFDIWIIKRDGSHSRALTLNGSLDTRPCVDPSGRIVYFLSNRGARTEGEESLKIWSLELPEGETEGT